MVYQPDIVPSSATGQALQAAIQKQLTLQGWSTEDDAVMAEYCVVMLGNKKTADQISSELSDLIGPDFDASFVTWLFAELARHYPDPSLSTAPSASAASTSLPESSHGPSGPSGPSGRRNDRNGGRGGVNVFGAAMSGVKRDASGLDRDGPNAQRQRFNNDKLGFDGVPAGPRNPDPRAGGHPGRGRRNDGADGRSIFDRVNGQGGPQYAQGGFDGPNNGANNGGFPGGPGAFMTPQAQAAMFQAQAAAMAQAFAAMQGMQQQGGWPGAPGVNPNAPAFNPAFQNPAFANGGRPGPPGAYNPNFKGPGGAGAGPGAKSKPAQTQKAAVPVPSKPAEEQICKHGVDCTKPTCPYSHPSPVATKESGLVLSSEACEKQVACEDPDCPKSHVSPSQKKTGVTAASTPKPVVPSAPVRAPPVADPSAIAGAGEKSCKFAGACTRPGCVFLHPWDVKGDPSATGGVPCRWAENCTRADCHFSHPPSRRTPFAAAGGKKAPFSAKNYTATFNNPKNPSIGAWPEEKPAHVSERLKRFNIQDGAEGEKIIPGQAKEEKLEIDLEGDGEGEAEEKVVEGSGVTA